MNKNMNELVRRIENMHPENHRVLGGLDGFIDQVNHVADERKDEGAYNNDKRTSGSLNRTAGGSPFLILMRLSRQ